MNWLLAVFITGFSFIVSGAMYCETFRQQPQSRFESKDYLEFGVVLSADKESLRTYVPGINTIKAGETLFIRQGWEKGTPQGIQVDSEGTSDKHITVAGIEPAQKVIQAYDTRGKSYKTLMIVEDSK